MDVYKARRAGAGGCAHPCAAPLSWRPAAAAQQKTGAQGRGGGSRRSVWQRWRPLRNGHSSMDRGSARRQPGAPSRRRDTGAAACCRAQRQRANDGAMTGRCSGTGAQRGSRSEAGGGSTTGGAARPWRGRHRRRAPSLVAARTVAHVRGALQPARPACLQPTAGRHGARVQARARAALCAARGAGNAGR